MDAVSNTERLRFRLLGADDVEFDAPIPGAEQGEVEYEILRSEWTPPR